MELLKVRRVSVSVEDEVRATNVKVRRKNGMWLWVLAAIDEPRT